MWNKETSEPGTMKTGASRTMNVSIQRIYNAVPMELINAVKANYAFYNYCK